MTSNIPRDICDQCCETCIAALKNICCLVDYDDCLDWACDAGSYQGGYTSFNNVCINAQDANALKEIADGDTGLFKHQILPNLFASAIVNKCKACFVCLCDTFSEEDIIFCLCVPVAFVFDSETLTPINTDMCLQASNDDITKTVRKSKLTRLLVVYYDHEIFSVSLHRFMPLLLNETKGWVNPMEWEDLTLVNTFHCIQSYFPWRAMIEHKPHAMQDLLHHIAQTNGISMNTSILCEGWLKGLKWHESDIVNKDQIVFCKAQVDIDMFTQALLAAKHEYEQYAEFNRKQGNGVVGHYNKRVIIVDEYLASL